MEKGRAACLRLVLTGGPGREADGTQPEEVIELFASVEGNKLVLKEPAPFPVHDNAIYIGKRKIIITLESTPQYPIK